MNAAAIVRRLSLLGMLLGLTVVVLGAWVRLTDAGLGCPDWPTCYGHVIPPADAIDSGKAWREMIHRYAATLLGLLIVLITAIAITYRRQRVISVLFCLALLATVVLQGLLGAFTVWWLVKPLVVLLHLIGGLATLSMLYWLWLAMRRATGVVQGRLRTATLPQLDGARRLAVLGTAALAVQIALGGWTSSNYAAVSCPDFPRCQNAWWPAQMDFRDAFVLWRGLDIDYTGGVLEHPARVAIHFTHRIGAIVASLALLLAAVAALRARAVTGIAPGDTTPLRQSAWLVLLALTAQLLIGITMVLGGFPLTLATAHNGGAALLLLAALLLSRRLRET